MMQVTVPKEDTETKARQPRGTMCVAGTFPQCLPYTVVSFFIALACFRAVLAVLSRSFCTSLLARSLLFLCSLIILSPPRSVSQSLSLSPPQSMSQSLSLSVVPPSSPDSVSGSGREAFFGDDPLCVLWTWDAATAQKTGMVFSLVRACKTSAA